MAVPVRGLLGGRSRRRWAAVRSLDTTLARLDAGWGTRELLSVVCEVLADALAASDCIASGVDLEHRLIFDVAGFTRSPERWRLTGQEYRLDEFPATRRVLETGRSSTTWLGDPAAERSEIELMEEIGVRAQLMLALPAQPVPYLVEILSDDRERAFEAREVVLAEAVVAHAAGLLEPARAADERRERDLAAAERRASQLGDVDRTVSRMAVAVGEAMCLSEEELGLLRLVGLVHDIGKAAIPARMLRKGELTPGEWAVMQRHTVIGQRMLRRMSFLDDAVEAVGATHERWDGGGYPHGLAGADIPQAAV
ncbi:MAG: HD-GYP domain-containing protein [Gaiellales bacterium]